MAIALVTRSRFSGRRVCLIDSKLQGLIDHSTKELQIQGFTEEQITYKVFKNIECEGSKTILMILKPEDGDFLSAFVQRHR